MMKKLYDWLFNIKEKQKSQAMDEYNRIEHRKFIKRGQ